MPQKTVHLETDYLVVGGGAMCMAFVDEILNGSRKYGNYRNKIVFESLSN